jgi:hypothetical protein
MGLGIRSPAFKVGDTSVGIVLEVQHPRAKHPDYRTPTNVLVYFPEDETDWNERWFHKQELEMVKK